VYSERPTHLAEAEGLGRLTKRVLKVRPTSAECCMLRWNNIFYWWVHSVARKCCRRRDM